MNDSTREGLDTARYLAGCGVPIFLAPPAMAGKEWDYSGGHNGTGYLFPRGWQRTKPDPSVLDRWREGWAVCAVMGYEVDGLDLDLYKGGHLNGVMPKVYGTAATPSDGVHHLIAPLGVPSRNGVQLGVDVKAGMADGTGRGFLFLAPTRKVSKVSGKVGAYRWVVKPNLEELLLIGGDTSGAALAELVRSVARSQSAGAYDGPVWETMTERQRARAAAEVDAQVAWWRRHLKGVEDWPEGERDDKGRGWEELATKMAWAIAKLATAPWAPEFDAEEVYRDLLPEALATDHKCRGKWTDDLMAKAATAVPDQPPWVRHPEPEDDFGVWVEEEQTAGARKPRKRTLAFTRASAIGVRPTHWLWEGRIALGTLALLAGREGIGKSTVAYWLAAQMTKGLLPGAYFRQPRQVLVAASEDSWEHTIVPRLMAAEADLDKVLRVDVSERGVDGYLTLPDDNVDLQALITEERVALVLLDPLMSRLDAKLDTHKDSEVRQALEPMTAIADRTRSAFLGLIHVNKSANGDALNGVMGSRAFTAVARSVLFAMKNSDDDQLRWLGLPKNNLGRTDLPTLGYRIESAHVADTEEGAVTTGRVVWEGETDDSIDDLHKAATEDPEARTQVAEAQAWLMAHLTEVGGRDQAKEVRKLAQKEGFSRTTLDKARRRAGVLTAPEPNVFPTVYWWSLPLAKDFESEV